jgi:hypothetical protein
VSVFPSLKCFSHLLTLLALMLVSPYTPQSHLYMTPAKFHKKFNDSMLTKLHVGDSHFLAVHAGNIRGAHALILCSCWRGRMLLMVL